MARWIRKMLIGVFLFSILMGAGCAGIPVSEPAKEPLGEPGPAAVAQEHQKVAVGPLSDLAGPMSIKGAEGESGREIVVSGIGKKNVVPDLAQFTVGVVITAETAQEAASINADRMDQVVKALKALGVAETDIQTSNVNIVPEFDYGGRGDGRELPVIIGYRAENRVSVKVRDVESTGKVIDGATAAGANQLYGLSFTLSEETSKGLRAQVLGDAVMDATDKAQAIAAAIGVKKINPIKVAEAGGYTPPLFRYDLAAAEKAGATTPVSPGEVEVTASVTMTFDFEY